jgi:hypothetical protein
MARPLDSGDQWDWSIAPGETIGEGNMEQTGDLLYVGIHDDSEGHDVETRITLALATRPKHNYPVGGTLDEQEKTPLYALAIGLALMSATCAYTLTRPRK